MSLPDGYFELNGVKFGDWEPIVPVGFTPGPANITASDINNPFYDEVYAGRDLLHGETWTFELLIHGPSEAFVLEQLGRLERMWKDRGRRTAAGELSELHYGWGGRTRVVYGRPRRFAREVTGLTVQREARVTCEFEVMDALRYDRAWQSVTLRMVPPEIRGLGSPLREEDLTTLAGGKRMGQIDYVGGDGDTPILIDIYGPCVNPEVTFAGRRLRWDLTVKEGQRLQVDTRRGYARMGGRSVVSSMGRKSRLKDIRIGAGQHEVSFKAVDPSMTSYARFWWRPAHYGF